MSRSIPELLARWRDAERRWEQTAPDDPGSDDARRHVLDTWLAYQEAAGYLAQEEMVLVADDRMRYVAANSEAHRVLGYPVGGIAGRSVADITHPTDQAALQAAWDEFLRSGRLDGEYVLYRRDGTMLRATFVARAHLPIAGLHTSRLRPIRG